MRFSCSNRLRDSLGPGQADYLYDCLGIGLGQSDPGHLCLE